jgi:hypothetical protein
MKTIRQSTPALRVVLGAVAALALLTAVTAAAAASGPITSEQFAPDWQTHARPLFRQGQGVEPGKISWYVPETLPRGIYVLVNRTKEKTELIDGYHFEVTGDPSRKIYMLVEAGYGDVEAIPAADVPSLKLRHEVVPIQ